MRKLFLTAAAGILLLAAVLFCKTLGFRSLTLRDRDTGDLIASYPVEEGDRFSVTFVHSVNKTPVTDVYEIEDGHIFVEECIYYGFGAGVQSQLNPGEELSETEDGGMKITGIHQNRDNVGYIVGTVSDHVLSVNGTEISLRDLCGKNAAVRFHYEKVFRKGTQNL